MHTSLAHGIFCGEKNVLSEQYNNYRPYNLEPILTMHAQSAGLRNWSHHGKVMRDFSSAR